MIIPDPQNLTDVILNLSHGGGSKYLPVGTITDQAQSDLGPKWSETKVIDGLCQVTYDLAEHGINGTSVNGAFTVAAFDAQMALPGKPDMTKWLPGHGTTKRSTGGYVTGDKFAPIHEASDLKEGRTGARKENRRQARINTRLPLVGPAITEEAHEDIEELMDVHKKRIARRFAEKDAEITSLTSSYSVLASLVEGLYGRLGINLPGEDSPAEIEGPDG